MSFGSLIRSVKKVEEERETGRRIVLRGCSWIAARRVNETVDRAKRCGHSRVPPRDREKRRFLHGTITVAGRVQIERERVRSW